MPQHSHTDPLLRSQNSFKRPVDASAVPCFVQCPIAKPPLFGGALCCPETASKQSAKGQPEGPNLVLKPTYPEVPLFPARAPIQKCGLRAFLRLSASRFAGSFQTCIVSSQATAQTPASCEFVPARLPKFTASSGSRD